MKKPILLSFLLLTTLFLHAQDGIIGEVRLFAGNFAPRNWAFCDGQMMNISTNQALFSVIGTQYGGDGRTTFALPKLNSIGNTVLEHEKSISTGGGLKVSFTATNADTSPIDMYWVDFTGQRKLYATIQPGQTVTQVSAGKHVWHFVKGATLIDAIKLDNTDNQQFNIRAQESVRYIICTAGVFPARN